MKNIHFYEKIPTMKMFKITPSGEVSAVQFTKKLLAHEFDMHTRDLRPILFLRQLFTISVRGDGIIMNLGSVKLCIGQQKAYFFPMLSEKKDQEFSDAIIKKITNKDSEDHHIPFEFLILEVAFDFVLDSTTSHFNSFDNRLTKLLVKLSENPTQNSFEELLRRKKELLRLEKTTQELQDALNEILEDDEEIASILLSEQKTNNFELEDVESILENILEQIMELSHKIYQHKESIDDTQEIITLKMSSTRNVMMQIDLLSSVGTAILAVGTLIAGFYGMNLSNNLEPSFTAFLLISCGVVLISLFGFLLFFRFMKKKKIWS